MPYGLRSLRQVHLGQYYLRLKREKRRSYIFLWCFATRNTTEYLFVEERGEKRGEKIVKNSNGV